MSPPRCLFMWLRHQPGIMPGSAPVGSARYGRKRKQQEEKRATTREEPGLPLNSSFRAPPAPLPATKARRPTAGESAEAPGREEAVAQKGPRRREGQQTLQGSGRREGCRAEAYTSLEAPPPRRAAPPRRSRSPRRRAAPPAPPEDCVSIAYFLHNLPKPSPPPGSKKSLKDGARIAHLLIIVDQGTSGPPEVNLVGSKPAGELIKVVEARMQFWAGYWGTRAPRGHDGWMKPLRGNA